MAEVGAAGDGVVLGGLHAPARPLKLFNRVDEATLGAHSVGQEGEGREDANELHGCVGMVCGGKRLARLERSYC